jgi:hypothetical protein
MVAPTVRWVLAACVCSVAILALWMQHYPVPVGMSPLFCSFSHSDALPAVDSAASTSDEAGRATLNGKPHYVVKAKPHDAKPPSSSATPAPRPVQSLHGTPEEQHEQQVRFVVLLIASSAFSLLDPCTSFLNRLCRFATCNTVFAQTRRDTPARQSSCGGTVSLMTIELDVILWM